MFLIDMDKGRIVEDAELKQQIAEEHPYGEWLKENLVAAESLPEAESLPSDDFENLEQRQSLWLYL